MTRKGNAAALLFLQPTQRMWFVILSGLQLPRAEQKAAGIPLKEWNGGRTCESQHPLSPLRAETRSRTGCMKLKMNLCS